MFSPEMMRMAQEKMAQMSPDQMAQMQAQMANMSPDMMQTAMSQMKNMSASDMKAAQDKMNGMSSDDMVKASQQAKSQQGTFKAQQEYNYNASMKLKTDGNYLVSTAKHSEAVEKYTRAISNLQTVPTPAGTALKTSCQLNLALCYVKLGKNDDAIKTCTDVLSDDPDSLKATYRRGQAQLAKGSVEAALVDLKRAHLLAPDDETVKASYDELAAKVATDTKIDEAKLKEAEAKIEAERAAALEKKRKDEEEKKSMEAMLQQGKMQSGAMEQMQNNPEMMTQAMEELKKNPDMLKNVGKMMKDMPPEQLNAMMKAKGMEGMPEMTPDMAKMMADQMENLTPEQLEEMSKMASSMGPRAAGSGASTSGDSGGDPMAAMNNSDMMGMMEEQMKNPEMRKMMNNMMKNITPEQMKSMSAATGMKMSYEQAEAMAKQMKGMKEEDLERMMTMATKLNKAKNFVMKHKLIIIAVVVLLVGLFLRWLGWA